MPRTDPSASSDIRPLGWTVVWRDDRTGREICGQPLTHDEALEIARAMNEAWPDIWHWAAPLAPVPRQPDASRSARRRVPNGGR